MSAQHGEPPPLDPADGTEPGPVPTGPVAPDPTERNYLGVISLTAGLVGLVSLFVPGVGGYLVLVTAVVALVAGVLCVREVDRGRAANRGLGLAGLTLGAAELILFVIALVLLGIWSSSVP